MVHALCQAKAEARQLEEQAKVEAERVAEMERAEQRRQYEERQAAKAAEEEAAQRAAEEEAAARANHIALQAAAQLDSLSGGASVSANPAGSVGFTIRAQFVGEPEPRLLTITAGDAATIADLKQIVSSEAMPRSVPSGPPPQADGLNCTLW